MGRAHDDDDDPHERERGDPMADMTPMRIGAESVLTDDVAEVRSPFDDHLVGPGAGRHRGAPRRGGGRRPRPPSRRRPAGLPARRDPRPAAELLASAPRTSPAASPTRRPSRSRPLGSRPRAQSTRSASPRRSARTLAGELVPIDASSAGVGKLAFALRMPDRRGRRDQPLQLPAQPRRPQGRAGHRGRVPGRARSRRRPRR